MTIFLLLFFVLLSNRAESLEHPVSDLLFHVETAKDVDAAVAKGANVNQPQPQLHSDRRTPLVDAALKGYSDVVRALLKHGADFKAADNHGITPLQAAGLEGRGEIIRILANAGANVREVNPVDHKSGLVRACQFEKQDKHHAEAVWVFLLLGADPKDLEKCPDTAHTETLHLKKMWRDGTLQQLLDSSRPPAAKRAGVEDEEL